MCDHVKLPHGSTAIICGLRRKKAAPCEFCGRPSTKLCDWPEDKPTKVEHGLLKPDDVVVTVQAKLRLPVQGLNRFTGQFRIWRDSGKEHLIPVPRSEQWLWENAKILDLPVTQYGLTFPKDRGSFLYYCIGADQVTVLRPGTCDRPCCERCSREVGEDRDYCKAHWDSWQWATAPEAKVSHV